MNEDAAAWWESVATVLPVPHQAPPPYTFGEAVEELALWAELARDEAWSRRANRRSLDDDVRHLLGRVGPSLRAWIEPGCSELGARDRGIAGRAARSVLATWRSSKAIALAFGDLCDAAKRDDATALGLRSLADVLASQIGEDALDPFGALRQAASELHGGDRWMTTGEDEADSPPPSVEARVETARSLLTDAGPVGDVVVWLGYRRAMAWNRIDVGPVTVLPAPWFLGNAHRVDGFDFPERQELRMVQEDAALFDAFIEELDDPDSAIVLVRVQLGERRIAGAVEAARRLVNALVSVGVGLGGVSWQSSETFAVLRDGTLVRQTHGVGEGRWPPMRDGYGMGATIEVLEHVAETMSDALTARPMPDYLVEAILAVREASMTDHRDVSLGGGRAITPRVAIALEDHAVELVASVAAMDADALGDALLESEAERRVVGRILGDLMIPFDRSPGPDHAEQSRMQALVSTWHRSTRIVHAAVALAQRETLLALTMTRLERAGLLEALAAAGSAEVQQAMLRDAERDARVERNRLRRVRNAINHGSPVTPAALADVGPLSRRRSRAAMDLALRAFAGDVTVSSLLDEEQEERRRRFARLDNSGTLFDDVAED